MLQQRIDDDLTSMVLGKHVGAWDEWVWSWKLQTVKWFGEANKWGGGGGDGERGNTLDNKSLDLHASSAEMELEGGIHAGCPPPPHTHTRVHGCASGQEKGGVGAKEHRPLIHRTLTTRELQRAWRGCLGDPPPRMRHVSRTACGLGGALTDAPYPKPQAPAPA